MEGFAVEFFAIAAPGMILGRTIGLGLIRGGDLVIDGFGIDNGGLGDGFVERGEIEGLVIVVDGDLPQMIFMDGDFGIAQGIGRALRLDLVDDILVMDGQVFGDRAGLLPGEDQIEIFRG